MSARRKRHAQPEPRKPRLRHNPASGLWVPAIHPEAIERLVSFGLQLIEEGTPDFFAIQPEFNLAEMRKLMELEAAVMDGAFYMVTGRQTTFFSDRIAALKSLPIRTITRLRRAQQEALA